MKNSPVVTIIKLYHFLLKKQEIMKLIKINHPLIRIRLWDRFDSLPVLLAHNRLTYLSQS